jgi:hypothetical protein
MSLETHLDELGVRPEPIVAIPLRWSRLLLIIAPIPGLIIIGCVALFPPSNPFWAFFVLPSLASIMLAALIRVRAPEFAVFREGIKVPFNRLAPKRSFWDPWGYGFYSWSEVSHVRSSPYQPGVLSIHLHATPHQLPPLFVLGAPAGSTMQVLPRICFYRVPGRHRAEVEAAIRAYGKWVD